MVISYQDKNFVKEIIGKFEIKHFNPMFYCSQDINCQGKQIVWDFDQRNDYGLRSKMGR